MPAAEAADRPEDRPPRHPYPEHPDNPVPRDGSSEDWRRWADGLTALRQFGVRCTRFEGGVVHFEMPAHVAPANPNGSVHGGVIAAIMDDAVGAAFVSSAPDDVLPATASLTVDYLRPAFVTLYIEATVTSQGRSLVHCEATVRGRDGRLACRARAIMAAIRVAGVPGRP